MIFAIFLFAKPVPYGNEFPYLLRLVREFQPEFLAGDWTFSAPANEHWLFNRVFGYAASFVSIETLGWTGRIVCWILLMRGLLQLGKIWNVSYRSIGASIALWLAAGQSLVGDEWIIGGFEAKSVSYIFLLPALYYFANRKIVLPSVLLGLSFAFHPAVGLWSALAVGLALLFESTGFKKLLTAATIIFIISLIGILPLLSDQLHGRQEADEIWRFMVLVRFPWHFDPFQFSRSYTLILLMMLAANLVVFYKSENFGLRFLLKFQIALGVFFIFGFALRWFEMYPQLRFLPVRLFPVFTPLFFAFTIAWSFRNLKGRAILPLLALFAAFCLFWIHPFGRAAASARETIALWRAEPDDLERSAIWIAENTPKGSVVIQPPNRRDVWYFSQRACVASYTYQTFGRLTEWRGRIADLTGNTEIKNGETAFEITGNAYNGLSEEAIREIGAKYNAQYVTSRADYSFPVVFRTETYKVYLLPGIRQEP